MTTCTIDGCGRPVEDAYVCQGCTLTLERELGDVRWLDEQLDIVLTKQTSGAPSVGYLKRTESDPALPYDPRATEVRWVLTNTITTWARAVSEEVPGARLPTIGGIGIMAAWLGSYSGALRLMDQGEAVGDLMAAVRSARRVVDVRPDRIYAGPCDGVGDEGCGQDLYGRKGASRIVCQACGREYDAGQRRAELLTAARDRLGTIREVVGLFGGSVSREQVKGWVRRGKVSAHGSVLVNGRTVATYRVGDVEDMANAEQDDVCEQRKTKRAGRLA